MKHFILKNIKGILFLLSIIATLLTGALIGIILVYQKGFPQIDNLEDMKSSVMTVIYDDHGDPVREFATEKRILVQRPDIPDILEKALIASEDKQFYSHWGINFRGTLRAILGVLTGKKLGGGSSITQQLARNLFLTNERTFSRKFQEILMAIQIEKKYSKDQILTYYCNKIYLGGSIYGVGSAARYYFGKSVKDINLAEAALIAAIIPNPYIFNVYRNPENCLRRRDFILDQMLELKFITDKQYNEALAVPLPEHPFEPDREEIGDYFVEDTRKLIESKFGGKGLYTGGLKVYTTLNEEMQRWAEEALREGLRDLDKREGWRGDSYPLPSWKKLKIEKGAFVKGVILKVSNRSALVKIDTYRGKLEAADTQWTKKKPGEILKEGDVALFRIVEVPDLPGQPIKLALEQEPEVNGAILAVENKTGAIKAMVGGYSFKRSQWNNATQALRQTGSTIKPIVYTAAIEHGFNPATMMEDEPVIYDNEWTWGPYEPQNDSLDFVGPITLRNAFEQSRNVISAKIVDYLTPPTIVAYAKKFGITSNLRPTMSIALGAYEVTLKEMVAAYTVFPNLGIRVNPFLVKKILNQNNHIIDETPPDRKKVIEETTAYIINYLMQGVVQWGTGKGAKHLNAPIGGKTGTTDDYTDAWFIGFSPSITVGVWVGFDIKKSLGEYESGSRAANPIFVHFMEKYLEKYEAVEPKTYRRPTGVIMVKIDKLTGKLATPDCLYPFWEAFIRGTEPLDYCRREDHEKIADYYTGNDEQEDF